MNKLKLKIRYEWVLALFFIVFFMLELINSRFGLNDFKVYYLAAQNLVTGKPIYGIPFGLDSGYYKYTPFALFPFIPISFLPYFWASSLYYFIIAFVFIVLIKLSFNTIINVFPFINKTKQTVVFLTILVVLNHVYREMHMGNINLLLTLIYVYSLKLLIEEKDSKAGLLIGLGIIFKPHFIALLPFLFLYKRYRTTGVVLLTILTGLLLPALFVGFGANIDLLHSWIGMLKMHNVNLSMSPDTIYAWINKLLGLANFQQEGSIYVLVLVFIISLKYLAFFLLNKNKEKYLKTEVSTFNKQHFAITYLMIIAFIPNLTVTDSQHYLFCLPLIMLLIGCLLYNKNIPLFLKILSIIGLVFYGGNWHDLIGHSVSVYITNNGFLGLGNMLIIAAIGSVFVIDNALIETFLMRFKAKKGENVKE